MDSLVFIAALGVGIALVCWYVLNEARGIDGTIGLFALKSGEAAFDPKRLSGAHWVASFPTSRSTAAGVMMPL